MNDNDSLWRRLLRRFGAAPADRVARPDPSDDHHAQAEESLRGLLEDPHIPPAIRTSLATDFAQLEAMLGRLERGELHLAIFIETMRREGYEFTVSKPEVIFK